MGWEHFSVALEGRADVPVTGSVDLNGKLRTSILAASLVPCGHYRWFAGCVLISAGALQGELVSPMHTPPDFHPYTAMGARGGLEWSFGSILALRVSADVLARVNPVQEQFQGRPTWASSPVAFLGGAGAVVRFGAP